jgi:histidinol phosphatase-like enzyme
MKILMDNRVPVAARLATLVSNIMTAMLARIRKQAGRKPHIKMLVAAIKMLIIEASRMALIAGVEVTDDDKRKAAKLAGDMLEAGNSPQGQQPMQGQPQGQPTPQQPQGIVGGAM